MLSFNKSCKNSRSALLNNTRISNLVTKEYITVNGYQLPL